MWRISWILRPISRTESISATDRFGDEGEPAILLIEGDVAHPEVYLAIDQFRANLGAIEPGIPQKVTTTPDGLPRVIAIDDLVDLAIISLAENATPSRTLDGIVPRRIMMWVAGASGSRISLT